MSLTMTQKITSKCKHEENFMKLENPSSKHNDCHSKDYSSAAQLLPNNASENCDNNNLSKKDIQYWNYRQLLSYEQAPEYIKHNQYIRGGYRKLLPTNLCWESIFWWTNETLNIWTHLFGLLLVVGLTINDLFLINIHATFTDKVVVALLLFCFQICMGLSALYHTFSCRSEHDYNHFLMFDLFGIALSLLAIYTSGVYYAFWCHPELRMFYMLSVTLIFIVAMVMQTPSLGVPYTFKTLVFIGWAAYGVLPTLHWTWSMGGFDNPMVQLLFPRVIGMYGISGTAFAIYHFKVPERWFPGSVDYIGHSHQWWHIFVMAAFYYWHNSGMIYVQYRMNHGCANSMRIF